MRADSNMFRAPDMTADGVRGFGASAKSAGRHRAHVGSCRERSGYDRVVAETGTRASELVVLRREGWAAYLVLQRGFSAENCLPLSRVSFVAGFLSSVHAKAAKRFTVSDRDQRQGCPGCQLVMQARKPDAG